MGIFAVCHCKLEMCNLCFDFIVCSRPQKGLWVLDFRILLILLVGFIINNLHERAFAMMYLGQRRKMLNVGPESRKECITDSYTCSNYTDLI